MEPAIGGEPQTGASALRGFDSAAAVRLSGPKPRMAGQANRRAGKNYASLGRVPTSFRLFSEGNRHLTHHQRGPLSNSWQSLLERVPFLIEGCV